MAEYLVTLNASDAHRRAGFKGKSHAVLGHRLLTKVNVAAAIAEAQAKRLESAGISAERVLKEIAKVGFASMRHVMVIDSDGQPQINLSNTPDDDLDALLEIQTETVLERDGVGEDGKPAFNRIRKTKIKFHDKLNALEKLAQHTGVYAKRDEDQVSAFAKAISEIQARTSKAPIRRDKQNSGIE